MERNNQLRVQEIRNQPGHDRVGVPERMAAYVNGAAKKTRIGEPNTLRQISRDDVERLSRGQPLQEKRLREPKCDASIERGRESGTGTGR
jgi:hypothetical protein